MASLERVNRDPASRKKRVTTHDDVIPMALLTLLMRKGVDQQGISTSAPRKKDMYRFPVHSEAHHELLKGQCHKIVLY